MSWNRIYSSSPLSNKNLKSRIVISWILVILTAMMTITLLVMNPFCIIWVMNKTLEFKLWIVALDLTMAIVIVFVFYILYIWMNMSGFNNWYQQTYWKRYNKKFLDDFILFFIYFLVVMLSMGFMMHLYLIHFIITLIRYKKIYKLNETEPKEISKSMKAWNADFKSSRFIKA